MTRRRLQTPGFSVSTKGHSVLRRHQYGSGAGSPTAGRRSYGYGLDYSSVSPVRSRYYSGESDYLDSQVQRATSIGSDVLYDTLDTANLSRNRDYDLLQSTNSAIQPPSPFSAVKARLSRISSNLPHRRFTSDIPSRQSLTSHTRSDISPIRDIDYSDTTSLVASPSPRPSHFTSRPHSTFRQSVAPENSTSSYSSFKDLDTKDLVASPPPQQGILPQRLLSLGRRAGLSTPITSSSSWRDYNLPVPTNLSTCPIFDDSYPMIEDDPVEGSSRLVHGYLPPSLVTKFGSPGVSPIGSGTQTPTFIPNYASRSKYADLPSLARSYTTSMNSDFSPELDYAEKQKHKVLGTKRHTGNYYERLQRRRTGRKERSKYWPYYDVESIAGSDVGDVLSDDEYGASGYTAPTYVPSYEYEDEDDDYVPFKPRYDRLTSPGLLEMSPYNESAVKPDISHLSSSYLLPKSTSAVSRLNENDSMVSALVAKSVAKAKEHLKDVNWGKYDNASLVLSVEGDMVHPENGERYGFRYYPQPISVRGGSIDERIMGVTPSNLSSGDSVFFNYVSKMRDFRGGMRDRLSDTLDTPSFSSRYDSLSKSILTRLPPLSPGYPSHMPQTSFKKRLEGGLTHQLDVYPLPLSEKAFPSQLELTTKPKTKDSKHDEFSREGPVTVLDRILIKVNSETHASPQAAVASLRARKRPQAQPASARVVNIQPRSYYQQVAFVRASSAPPLGRPVVVYAAGSRQSSVPRSSSPYVERARSPSIDVYERSQSVDREYYTPYDYLLRQPTAARVIREARERTRRPYSGRDQRYLVARYDRSIRKAQRALSPLRYDYESDYVVPTRVGLFHYLSPTTSRQDVGQSNYYTSSLTARRPYRRFRRALAFARNTQQPVELPHYELMYAPRNLYQNEVFRVLEPFERPRFIKRKPRSLYAAIVASKLEDEPGSRRRRTPKSKYAADKYRSTHRVGENPLYYSNQVASTASLTSSGPTSQKTTDRKAVRDMDGNFTKPRNILSWQYRLDSRVPPEEVLYRPTTFNRMRERLHEAQDKMDRHRQLLDRYIPDEGTTESIESRVNRKLSELETRDASGGGQSSVGSYTPFDYYGPNGPPISETRRRIRRVLNGTRR
ncbi:hypothetical protein SNE40_008452 [Patella caerulea]|uniref:Uncharacterized protein n=1 Tax=Patella caerulea TaxID=87958 RepID=A0AAN8K188_PATCE